MAETHTAPKTQWHTIFGALLKPLLTPVGVEVTTNVAVMSQPPEADILLLRRERPHWTKAQRSRLPDGIRDCRANHILIEFKYTESLNFKVFRQAIGYDYFYQRARKLGDSELRTFVVSSKTPHSQTLTSLQYRETGKAGVYASQCPTLERIGLLVLNDLANTVHNAPFKCFASRQHEKQNALLRLMRQQRMAFPQQFWAVIKSLWEYWFLKEQKTMNVEMTPEELEAMDQFWGEHFLSTLTPDSIFHYITPTDLLAKMSQEDILNNINPEDFLANMDPEVLLTRLKPEVLLSRLKPEDRLAGLKPEDRLAGLKPEDRLAGLKPEEIEEYLKKLKEEEKQS